MSINVFLAAVLGLLMGMYFYFTPTYPSDRQTREIPQIQLHTFTLYEISKNGVDHILEGEDGKKFENRYEITSAKFSDNTKSLFQSIQAENMDYQKDVVRLKANVLYHRADGLEFRSNEGQYDTKASLITTEGAFVITQNGNRVEGEHLYYNTEQNIISADAVRGSYQLK